ncbi:MAG TPA: hypothetical protein VN768_02600, partial [Acidimicrobiales bacterium]|nr:hypothetical protein [Acidimicrobiales bacterium]
MSELPPQTPGTTTLTEAMRQPDHSAWNGPKIRYDLVKEFVIALVAMALLAVALAVVFSSPDDHPVTIRQWAQADPADFLATAVTELDGTSPTATYGPPYNSWAPGEGQKLGPIGLERWAGVHIPVNSAEDFVLSPLRLAATSDARLRAALTTYGAATAARQQAWTAAYTNGVAHVKFPGDAVVLPPGRYGPVAPMMTGLLTMAQTGGLDADLLASPQFYGTDYTKPLLFIADGSFLASEASAQHLQGDQWGMMNETGNYPGQAWLWLYTMWYQVAPFNTSSNGDVLVWALMMVLTLGLLLVPFIPGVRSIPRLVPVYKLIWRDHYRRLAAEGRAPPAGAHGGGSTSGGTSGQV